MRGAAKVVHGPALINHTNTTHTHCSEKTDMGRWAIGEELQKQYVDRLFNFSRNLGQDYTGTWLDQQRFQVTIKDAAGVCVCACVCACVRVLDYECTCFEFQATIKDMTGVCACVCLIRNAHVLNICIMLAFAESKDVQVTMYLEHYQRVYVLE